MSCDVTVGTPVQDRSSSLTDRAYATLRDRLVLLDIAPGEPLDDHGLARELGTGRTPVRQALKQLEQDRLVVVHQRRGTFAAPIGIADLAHVGEIRAELEPLAAARAARTGPVSRRRLADLGTVVVDATDRRELVRQDVRAHRAVYAATGNPHLEDVLVRQYDLTTRIRCLFADRLRDPFGDLDAHRGLLAAIGEGAAEEAARLALREVATFEAAVRAVL